MCDICMKSPHDPRCPNATVDASYICEFCQEPIADGDVCYELDGDHWHEECFNDNAVDILLERFEARKEIARGY